MSIEEKLNHIATIEFKRTDEPYDYRYGLSDEQLDISAFCCEVERLYGFKAEDVFEVLKGSIIDTSDAFIKMREKYPVTHILDIQDAIIKFDGFIDIKKQYMQAR